MHVYLWYGDITIYVYATVCWGVYIRIAMLKINLKF